MTLCISKYIVNSIANNKQESEKVMKTHKVKPFCYQCDKSNEVYFDDDDNLLKCVECNSYINCDECSNTASHIIDQKPICSCCELEIDDTSDIDEIEKFNFKNKTHSAIVARTFESSEEYDFTLIDLATNDEIIKLRNCELSKIQKLANEFKIKIVIPDDEY